MGGHPSACKAGHQRYSAQRDELRLRTGTDDYLIHIDVGWLLDRERNGAGGRIWRHREPVTGGGEL